MQIKELESRISALESSKSFAATKDVLQQEQMKMLTTLREIRAALLTGEGNALGSGKDLKEMEAMRMENEELKKKVSKSEYRIKHLIRAIEELQKK